MIQSCRVILPKGLLVTRIQNGSVIALTIIVSIVFCEILTVAGVLGSEDEGDLDTISNFPRRHSVVNPAGTWKKSATAEKRNNSTGRNISASEEEEPSEGKFHGNSSTSAHANNISDYIRNGELSAIFCERCTDSQKKKVEQILYLLYNFNNNVAAGAGTPTTVNSDMMTNSQMQQFISQPEEPDKSYVLLKKKKHKFKATSSPVPVYRKNLPEMIPTPDTVMSSYHHHRQLNRVVQLPSSALSSTTPATISPGYSSMAIPIVPYFYSSAATSPLPSSSTTVSSALEPVQSVEMPTPPMPPTTTGPIYLYYLGGGATSSSSSLSSSGSLEPPSTPVMESSVAYASRPTTMEPMLL